LVNAKPSMPEDSEDELGTRAEASKAAIAPGAEVADTAGQSMAQVVRDMALAPRLRIQLRGIGWEPVPPDLGMCLHRRLDHLRTMGVEPLPDEEEARKVSLAVTAGDHQVIPAAGRLDVSLVNVARQGQPEHRRACPALADTSQDGGLPHRSPRAPSLGPAGAAGLIAFPSLDH
jgi:hypothetical protein